MLGELEVAAVIDEAAGPRPPGQPLPTGTYLALAALNRLVSPCSKAGFADWWKTCRWPAPTAAPSRPRCHWPAACQG